MLLGVSGVVAVGDAAAAQEEPPDRTDRDELLDGITPSTPDDDPHGPSSPEQEEAPAIESEGVEPRELSWPEPGRDAVTLGDRGDEVAVRDTPLELAAAATASEDAELDVQVRGRSVADAAGVSGFVFELTAPDGSEQELADLGGRSGLPVDLKIDYRDFAEAFGGSYVDRLQVVALPPCALRTPRPAGCRREGVEVPSHVDAEAEQLVVDVEDLGALRSGDGLVVDAAAGPGARPRGVPDSRASGGSSGNGDGDVLTSREARDLAARGERTVVLALTSGPSGETGDYGASPLSVSSSWQVAPGSGEFSWSYDMPTPAPPGGAAPTVGLSYSSGAVDGLTAGANTQSGQNGVGWSDFAGSFVERRYASCSHGSMGANVKDLCWAGDNATLSLNGRSSELLPIDTAHTTWRMANDPGWLIERIGTIPNEHWQVTTPDGTRYIFGTGSVPKSTTLAATSTNSRWTVPVWADDAGEPCRGPNNTAGACDQAWRWNLERVIDPHGIETHHLYIAETNSYLTLGGWGSIDDSYVRGGRLSEIHYGLTPFGVPTAGQPGRPAPGRVVFAAEYRCNALDQTCASNPPTPSNAHLYPDVPNDMLCTSDCFVTTPTFFTSKRYASVSTQVRVAGGWEFVDIWNLGAAFQDNGETTDKMYLNTVQRVGASEGGLVNMPAVSFLGEWKVNRVDIDLAAGKLPMQHQRLTTIVDEYGHQTLVTYGQPQPCPTTFNGPWDTNQNDCFPVYGREGTAPSAVFHKYLTTKVREVDPTGGSPTVTTDYTYEGDPALRYAVDLFMPARAWTWNQWRGYSSVLVTQGDSRTRLRVFRGMHGDSKYAGGESWPATPTGTRVVPALASQADPSLPGQLDEEWMAGAQLEEQRLGEGSGPPILEATVHRYETRTTAPPGWPAGTNYADWIGETDTWTLRRKPDDSFAKGHITTTFNANYRPTTVHEDGDVAVTGDERCTRTTYAPGEAAWKVVYPTSVVVVAGACSSTTELSRSETYYDGSTSLATAPTRADATRQRVQVDASTWVDTATMTYDAFGRILTVEDAKAQTTTTEHEPTTDGSIPAWTKLTDPKGHMVQTFWNRRGAASTVIDANLNETTTTYDDLGRVVGVRFPTEQAAEVDSLTFEYFVDGDRAEPPVVHSSQLQELGSPDRHQESWVLYDSFLRPRETHTLSPTPGRALVTKTNYDASGRVRDATAPKSYVGTAGEDFLAVSSDNWTRYEYDVLGREISTTGMSHSDANKWQSTTSYTHDTATVTPAVGGATRTTTDALGRVVKVEEQAVRGDTGSWVPTTYDYDLAGNMTGLTDAGGNTATYSYNKVGWRTAMDDPDAGTASYTYDELGNLETGTDAKGQVIWNGYDELSRPTSRRVGGPTGTELARWAYDATGEKGLPDKSTRVTPQGDWVTDVTGYDAKGRALGTKLTVPAGVPGLSGDYTTSVEYDRSDNIVETHNPAVPAAGLPAETVTTAHNTLGLPEALTGLEDYVWATGYDDRARPSLFAYGPHPGGAWMARGWAYDTDDRLSGITTFVGSATVANTFGFDDIGNVKTRTTQLGSQSWRECYTHDDRNRMTEAFTVPTATACDSATAQQKGTGDQPYEQAFTYSADGRMLTRADGGVTDTYGYPAGPDADRPHAPTSVGQAPTPDSYTWDANGSLTERVVGGDTETLTWDVERQLASVAGPSGTTGFVYDAGGQRLLRTTPQGRTLYFAGHEIRASLDGATVTATRTYTFGGQLIATRTGSGAAEYVTGDQQASVIASAPGGQTPDVTRAYDPYGRRRSGGELDSDRGWLGQVEDDTTDLAYLNARYYDPEAAVFLSPDPIYDPARPQTINPYAYGLGNPATMTDPSGLMSRPDGLTPARWKDPYAEAISIMAAGTERSSAMRAIRPKGYHYSTLRPPPDRRAVEAQLQAELQRRRDEKTLTAMLRANPDVGFWRALASAGSGQNLSIAALHSVNPDPAHWGALAAAMEKYGGYEGLVNAGNARRTTIGRSELFAAGVVHAPFGAAGIDAWRKKVDFQQTFGYGHRARGLDKFIADQCHGSWQENVGCVGVGAGVISFGAGVLGATGLATAATAVGTAGQAILTVDDCRSGGMDGSCVVNIASTGLGFTSLGLSRVSGPLSEAADAYGQAAGAASTAFGWPIVGRRLNEDQ
jgi:RHS repeat-associated protein